MTKEIVSKRFSRHLSAILYADVAGYSRLMGEDEDVTHVIIDSYLDHFADLIVQYKGRVVHYAGDAVLAEFGAAVYALGCAVEIQQVLKQRNQPLENERKVEFRIGINLGDVIHHRGEISGDGVNCAARLEALADVGGIFISEAIKTAVGRKLPVDFQFVGEKEVKNIADPLRVHRVLFDSETAIPESYRLAELDYERELPHRVRTNEVAPEHCGEIRSPVSSGKPSIAVLPFDRFNDESVHDYFADGFCEDLITELARFRTLAVIARTSSFAFRDQNLGIKEIGGALNVDFILEGSIRAFGAKLRVTAQLIECENGSHMWADRYDCNIADVFTVQDRLIGKIVSVLENQVSEELLRRVVRMEPNTLQAYDLWLRGNKLMQSWKTDDDEKARLLFEKAISLDPEFARPYGNLGEIYNSRCLLIPGNLEWNNDQSKAYRYAEKAIELDPLDGKHYISLAWIQMVDQQFDLAEASLQSAVRTNPNDANIIVSHALGVAYLGDNESALADIELCKILNPFHPAYYRQYEAIIRFLARDFNACTALLSRSSDDMPVDFLVWLIMANAYLGLKDEAHTVTKQFVDEIEKSWAGKPNATLQDYVDWFWRVTPLKQEEGRAILVEGLELAALPLPSSEASEYA